jgi:beta-lactam-binding protein with PASTA domain
MACKPEIDPRRLLHDTGELTLAADTLMAGTLRLQLADHAQRVATAEKALARAEAEGASDGELAEARARLATRVARRDALAARASAADIRHPEPDPDRGQVFGRVTGTAGRPPLTAALVEATGQPLVSACVKENGAFLLAVDGGAKGVRLQLSDADREVIFRDRDGFDLSAGQTLVREVTPREPAEPCAPPPQQAVMPDLLGQSERLACAVLTRLGVAEIAVDRVPAAGQPGLVIKQLPAAGAVLAPGGAARLTVSAPREDDGDPEPEAVIVPDLLGRPLREARTLLAQLGLRIAATTRADAATAGTVLEQDPAAGTTTDPGAEVAVVASTGEAPVRTGPVPDLVGLPEARAAKLAEEAGFPVARRVADDPERPGLVVAQSPAAGSVQVLGVVVTITVGAPRTEAERLEVPDFRGADVKEARKKGVDMGFVVSISAVASDAPAGRVLAQEPAPGTRVPAATPGPLTLGASSGPQTEERLVMPDLRGQPGERAAERAKRLGFEVETRAVVSDRPEGEVVDQSPAPGTVLTAPGRLRLDLSRGPRQPVRPIDPVRPTPVTPIRRGAAAYPATLARAAAEDARLARLGLDAATLTTRLGAAGVRKQADLDPLLAADNEALRAAFGLDGLAQARTLRAVLRAAAARLGETP